MSELFGRDQEVDDVVARLARRRLVTITGPGGVGKTSVARAVAGRIGHTFELGVHVVDLTRVDTSEAVAGAIAGQLGFTSFETLLDSPSDQPALLIADNCEHVIADVAAAIAALLDVCEVPTVLATSRSPLDLPDESLVVLGPLSVPAPGSSDGDTAAVRLFLERARDAGATVRDDEREAVRELCRRLDGLPLALEIAAARMRTMRVAEIVDRLGDGVDVLARPRFRGDRRHRSVAAAIDWSYRLLDTDVAALFDRLSVVPGPFTAAIAVTLGAGAGLEPDAVDDALTALIDSSLLVTDPADDATRYRMLETVRAFALAQLEQRGELDRAHDCFVDHVVADVASIMSDGVRRWDTGVFNQLLSLYDSIASALRWCLAHDDDGSRGLLLASVLWGVVHHGHTDDIAVLSDEAVRRWPDVAAPFFVDAAATSATAKYLTGDAQGAIALAERVLPAAESSPFAPFTLPRLLGYATRALGDTQRAAEMFARAARAARAGGLPAMAMEVDVSRAQLLAEAVPDAETDFDAGSLDEALRLVGEVRAEAAAAGSHLNDVWARTAAGGIRLQIDAAAAIPVIEDALAEARRINYPAAISVNLRMMALAHIACGQLAAAAIELRALFDDLVARGAMADLRAVLHTTAVLLHRSGCEAWADLATTARSLSIVSMTADVDARSFPLPDVVGTELTRREAIVVARRELRALLDSTGPSAAGSDAATDAASDGVAEVPVGIATPGDGHPPDPSNDGTGGLEGSPSTTHPDDDAMFADRGEWWEIRFAGRTAHVNASKGIVDLARLLAAPDREIHCLELMGAAVEERSTGETIDAVARRQYEERVRELQDEIDAAEDDNDLARADHARIELDTLVDHLTAALGLHGRSRRAGGSSTERARSAVTQRLRSTIRRLATTHPELGRHLKASVATGTYCSYRPEHRIDWQTELSN